MKKKRIASSFLKAACLFALSSQASRTERRMEKHRPLPLRTWIKIGAVGFIVVAICVAWSVFYYMFSGPRMRVEPKYLPYRMVVPQVPAGIVPVSSPTSEGIPLASQLRNPLPDTAETRENGRIYYGYYCAFCHGKAGEKTGPVGLSYVPAPTPLSESRVQNMSGGELYRAMLTGVGHELALPYIIVPEARWYIVSYVRTLGRQASTASGG